MRGLLYKAFSAMGQGKVARIEADSAAPREAQLRKAESNSFRECLDPLW